MSTTPRPFFTSDLADAAGSGVSLIAQPVPPAVRLNTLAGGTNIAVAEAGGVVTVASTGDNWVFREEATSGTSGGGFTAGAWQVRALTASVGAAAAGAALAANQITLQPGTYHVRARAPACGVGSHQARLTQNGGTGTAAPATLVGTSELSTAYFTNAVVGTASEVEGQVVVSGGTAVMELQHRCEVTNTTNGLGAAAGFGTEVYSVVHVKRTA